MLRSRSTSPMLDPSSPRRKWRAITIASLLLVPAHLGIVAGLVAVASDRSDAPPAGPPIAFGLGLLPFVFIALAFLSGHPRAPGAAAKAMGLCLLVGIPVAAIVPDAVTGLVAGVGAGGAVALRDVAHQYEVGPCALDRVARVAHVCDLGHELHVRLLAHDVADDVTQHAG